MRLVRFSTDGSTSSPGVAVQDRKAIVDLQRVGEELDVAIPDSTRALLTMPRWQERLNLLEAHALDTGTGLLERDSVSLEAPIQEPQKIICVGLNYIDHIAESDEERPENPILFSKFPTAIVGPGDAIAWDPDLTDQVDFEVELAAVVGEAARRIDGNPREYLAGYTVANDVSARDLQFADDQWTRGKSLDTFCPIGPAIVTEDEISDPEDLSLWSDLNGDRMQESSTSNLIFGIDELVSFCSDAFTLYPGDLILTGTPTGVGVFRDPPVLLEDGKEITVGVEWIGELTNPCKYE